MCSKTTMPFYGLTILLWKNDLLLRRRKCLTLCAIFLPCVPIVFLMLIKNFVDSDSTKYEAKTFLPFDMTSGFVQEIDNYFFKEIMYTPTNNVTDTIMNIVLQQFPGIKNTNKIVTKWQNEEEIENSLLKKRNPERLCAIIFLIDLIGKKFDYKLRFSFDKFNYHVTDGMKQKNSKPGPTDSKKLTGENPGYVNNGFIQLQIAIDKAIITFIHGKDNVLDLAIFNETNISYNRMPYPSYTTDSILNILQLLLSTVIVTAFMMIVVQVARNIVLEKERRLKEALKIMGITNATHWMAWFITYFLMTSLTVIFIVALLTTSLTKKEKIFMKSNPILLFIFLEMYSISMLTFAFAVSVSFKKASTASTMVAFIFFLSYLPKYAITPNSNRTLKTILCLFPNVGLGVGIDIICFLELHRSGLTWKSMGIPIESVTLITLICFFILTAAIFMTATLYQECVWPGEYGIPLPWYFPVQKTFWFGGSVVSEVINKDTDVNPLRKMYFEDEPRNLKPGIQIRKLNKIFYPAGKMRIAVDNLSMNLYEGNITVLLGHNGAGKTTTMSILTGFLPPTDGTAFIHGLDIRKDMDKIRHKLGLCPQHDILFDDLTVEEHMKLFAKLKGYKGDMLTDEINFKLNSVNLSHKTKALTKTLSGGMKRRLSIAMALAGGSEIVILDEPTSGLDPHARHEMWTLLQKERKNRTILLSTHFMDEAEILGDQIGIMANGSLLCLGSPMFLKNAYGAEYQLTLVKTKKFNISILKDLLKEFVPDYRLEGDINDEITFCLPTSSSHTFPKLFEKLESNLTKIGISSFGASITNIEQVFLKAENYDEYATHGSQQSVLINNDSKQTIESSSETCSDCPIKFEQFDKQNNFISNVGFKLLLQQTIHIFLKNVFNYWQRKTRTIIYTLIPIAIFLLAFTGDIMNGSEESINQRTQSEIKMDLNLYSGNILSYKNVNVTNPQHKIYLDEFLNFFTTQSSSKSIESVSTTTSMDSYLIAKGEEDLSYYIEKYLLGLQLATITDKSSGKDIVSLLAYFNHEDIHTPAIMQNFISNVLLRVSGKKDYIINTISHILPNVISSSQNFIERNTKILSMAICLIFGMAVFISTFSEPIIEEKFLKVKQLQYLSGCKSVSYWLGTFLRDFLHTFVVTVFIIIILAIFKEYAYLSNARFLMMIFLFMMFSFVAMPQVYLLSNLFSVPSSGPKWLTTIIAISNMLIFFFAFLASFGIFGDNLRYGFPTFAKLLFPLYALAQGFHDMHINYNNLKSCSNRSTCESGIKTICCNCDGTAGCYIHNNNYFGWNEPGIGKIILFLAIQGVIYWFIIFFVETSLFEGLMSKFFKSKNEIFEADVDSQHDEDSDVTNEMTRINTTDINNLILKDSLVVQNLKKTYGKFNAVDGITFGIKPGVCFGLLGVNGAGKTTTFKMMTGEIRPTKGEVYINSHNLAEQFNEARNCIGFCPQEHVLLNELTARQQLTLYFNLRGFDTKIIPKEVEKLIYLLDLTPYADEPCGKYSGGNKRKLSTAIALVGNPELVFLDEPTSGMDPGARRHVWNTLTKYKANKKTLVLTSHSMEECEVLCNQVVIMVNGRFKCFGSIQHLKSKFAEGYTVLVQLNYPDEIKGQENIANLIQYLDTNVKNYFVLDQRQSYLNLHFNKTPELSWSKLFGLFENIRESMNIIHYSVSQASLESVFMRFAKEQIPPVNEEESSGCCCCKSKARKNRNLSEPFPAEQTTITTTSNA